MEVHFTVVSDYLVLRNTGIKGMDLRDLVTRMATVIEVDCGAPEAN